MNGLKNVLKSYYIGILTFRSYVNALLKCKISFRMLDIIHFFLSVNILIYLSFKKSNRFETIFNSSKMLNAVLVDVKPVTQNEN